MKEKMIGVKLSEKDIDNIIEQSKKPAYDEDGNFQGISTRDNLLIILHNQRVLNNGLKEIKKSLKI